MQLQIAALLFFIMSSAFASNDKTMNELFKKYDLVMDEKKVELVDEVFSKKFLRENGGKEDFIDKVKSLPIQKNAPKMKISWRKGVKDDIFFAKASPAVKSKTSHDSPEFIIVNEDGKLKIDGTLGDAE